MLIKDPARLSWSSSISKNPTKYGYQIVDSIDGQYQWTNNNWTTTKAKEFAAKVEAYIASRKSMNLSFTGLLANYPANIYIEEKTTWLKLLYTEN